jgi:hypothetical protein
MRRKESVMAEQMRPSSKKDAPNPAHSYERTDPNRESGAGRLDADITTPTNRPDQIQESPGNRSDPTRQLNAEEGLRAGERRDPGHSMFEDEPTDADLAPHDIQNPRRKRNPRTGGKGGTPDEGDARRKG